MTRALATLVIAVTLAACTGPAASSLDVQRSPSATAEPIAEQTPTPNPSPTLATPAEPSADASPPAGTPEFLASTADGLRLRTGPGVAEPAFVFRCNPETVCTQPVVLDAGGRALALAGPVAADGYDWYLLMPDVAQEGSGYLGWAATPQTGDPWLIPVDYDCPPEAIDLDAAISIGNAALLHCYGNESLQFEGYPVSGFGCGGFGTYEPSWLAHPCQNMSVISPVASTDGDGRLFFHYPAPGVTNPTLDLDARQLVRSIGHLDDPAAATCVIQAEEESRFAAETGTAARDPAADVAVCRLRFVVTEVTVETGN